MRVDFRNPWWVVFGSVFGLMFSISPVLFHSFGVFLKPISEEFGTSRASAAAATTVGNIALMIGTPIAGRLVDRLGARTVAAFSIGLLSLATAAISFSPSLSIFLGLFALAALLGSGQTPIPYATILSGRFDRKRGLALGIATAGVGLGAALLPPLILVMIGLWGWRGAYVGLGVLTFVIALPALLLFVRAQPGEERGLARGRDGEALPGLSARAAVRTIRFWILALSMFSLVMVTIGTGIHLMPFLTDHGVSAMQATAVLSVAGLAQFFGRLGAGLCLDRFAASKVAILFFLTPILGLVLLALGGHGIAPFMAAALIGVAAGAELDLMAFMVSRYFGLKAFGEIFGYQFAAFTLGASIGPVAMGFCFDRTGSYIPGFAGFGIICAVAALLVSRLGPYLYPVVRERRA